MAADNQRQQFDEIVARITAEDPTFGRDLLADARPLSRRPRAALITAGVILVAVGSSITVIVGGWRIAALVVAFVLTAAATRLAVPWRRLRDRVWRRYQ